MSGPTLRQRWRDAIRDADDPRIDVYAIAVAMALDRFMDPQGRTHTGVRRLARLARESKNTVVSRIDVLETAGWLKVDRPTRQGGRSSYHAVIPECPTARDTPECPTPPDTYPAPSHPVGQSTGNEQGNGQGEVSHRPPPTVPPGGTEVSHGVTKVSHPVGPIPGDPGGVPGIPGARPVGSAGAPPPAGAPRPGAPCCYCGAPVARGQGRTVLAGNDQVAAHRRCDDEALAAPVPDDHHQEDTP